MNYQYWNPYLQQMQPVQMPQQQSQVQSIISVRNEDEAKNYPVAPGNSIVFRDETAPYIYTKTMGMSQLDRPTFEKFRLLREGEVSNNDEMKNQITSMSADIASVNETIKSMTEQIDYLKKRLNRPKKQIIQEVEEDD